MIISLIIIYILCGQSKMKTLVTNLALQHLGPAEATDCNCQIMYMQTKLVHCRFVNVNVVRYNIFGIEQN